MTSTSRRLTAGRALRPAPGRLERLAIRPLGPRQVLRDLGRQELVNGLVGALFAMTGPVAVILAVGTRAGLEQELVASWVFAIFVLNGLLTVLMSWVYRQPLGFFWTIPGTVVVGQALTTLTWSEVIGAYLITAVLMLRWGWHRLSASGGPSRRKLCRRGSSQSWRRSRSATPPATR
jgi:benzoate membrane transport protein